jgi:hypothetical protein
MIASVRENGGKQCQWKTVGVPPPGVFLLPAATNGFAMTPPPDGGPDVAPWRTPQKEMRKGAGLRERRNGGWQADAHEEPRERLGEVFQVRGAQTPAGAELRRAAHQVAAGCATRSEGRRILRRVETRGSPGSRRASCRSPGNPLPRPRDCSLGSRAQPAGATPRFVP